MVKLLETEGNSNPTDFKIKIQYELLKADGKIPDLVQGRSGPGFHWIVMTYNYFEKFQT